MTKKQILKLSFMMIISGIVGAFATLGLIQLADSQIMDLGPGIAEFLNDQTIEMHVLLFVLLMLPTLYFHNRGKGIYKNTDHLSDEELDAIEKKSSVYLDLSVTLNSAFLVMNFMLFGVFFKNTTDNQFLVALLFLIGQLFTTGVELTTIKFIKKIDERLKGDPTSIKFSKDYLDSCDEAQQLKIYKSGYQAFQFSRFTTLALVVVSILLNLVFDTGGLSVFLCCFFLLIQMLSYSYYGTRSEKN